MSNEEVGQLFCPVWWCFRKWVGDNPFIKMFERKASDFWIIYRKWKTYICITKKKINSLDLKLKVDSDNKVE